MNKLSESQVKTLNTAIDKTMDIIDSGNVDPNDAIIKVAQDMKLTKDYIPVIVAAYNNGTQYATREKGHSITEKTAKFKLADETIICNKLYNNNTKSAGYYKTGDDFFDLPISVTLSNSDKKYANLLYAPVPEYTTKKASAEYMFKAEQHITDSVNSIRDDVSMEKQAAADAYNDAIKDLAYYLRRVDAPSVPYAMKLASIVHGNEGVAIIKDATKRFSLPLKTKQLEPVIPASSQFYKECSLCITKLAEYNKACDDELSALHACADMLKPVVTKRVNSIYKQSSSSNMSPSYFFQKKKDSVKQAASILPEALSNSRHDARGRKLTNSDLSGLEALLKPQWRDLNVYEHNIMRSLDDPEHESKLRDIAVSANIADLINTDEYLSDKDPEEVIDAYNELMEIAPEIHNKKPLLRAALRQYMESGGIDVQSLGLIGDIGRKTESRRDDANKALAERVDKMLEMDEKGQAELRKWEREDRLIEAANRFAKSEREAGEKARSEESKKQRKAKAQTDMYRAALDYNSSINSNKLKLDMARAGAKADALAKRDKALMDFVINSFDPTKKNNAVEVNEIMSDPALFNSSALSDEERKHYVDLYKAYGGDMDAIGRSNRIRNGFTPTEITRNSLYSYADHNSTIPLSPRRSSRDPYKDIEIGTEVIVPTIKIE